MRVRSFSCTIFAFTLVVSSCLVLVSCGKKTLPKLLKPEAPPEIQDLQVEVQFEGAQLSWSVPESLKEAKEGSYCFSVQRATLSWKDRDCPDCPPLSQEELLCIDTAYPELAVVQEGKVIWVDKSIHQNRAYRYQIGVKDKKGRSLSLSKPVVVKVVPPPPAPQNLTANSDPRGILLQWQFIPAKKEKGQSVDKDLRFLIERRISGKAWEIITPLPIEEDMFLDAVVSPDEVYDYRVSSVFVYEENTIRSQYVEIKGIKAPQVAESLPPPHTVWVVPVDGALEIHWAELDIKVKGYHVYRQENGEITRLTADPVEGPTYVDHQVKPNKLYLYAISAVSAKPPYSEGLVSKWVEIKSYHFK